MTEKERPAARDKEWQAALNCDIQTVRPQTSIQSEDVWSPSYYHSGSPFQTPLYSMQNMPGLKLCFYGI